MRKIKSPWYGVLWIGIWTGALAWFLTSGIFTVRESVGLVLVWLVLVGITLYTVIQHFRVRSIAAARSRQERGGSSPLSRGNGKGRG